MDAALSRLPVLRPTPGKEFARRCPCATELFNRLRDRAGRRQALGEIQEPCTIVSCTVSAQPSGSAHTNSPTTGSTRWSGTSCRFSIMRPDGLDPGAPTGSAKGEWKYVIQGRGLLGGEIAAVVKWLPAGRMAVLTIFRV